MANICDNTLYAYSENKKNIEYIKKYFEEEYKSSSIDDFSDNSIDISFESKWCFPLEIMEEMVKKLPNEDDIFIRCLSVEYGVLYHELWIYENKKWSTV